MSDNPSDQDLKEILQATKTVAVVGASTNPDKPAHAIPAYLARAGYRVVPVTPATEELFCERAYASLRDVPMPIDVVDVFRPADEAPAIARDAAAAGAKVLWLQEGVVSQEAADIAHAQGMKVVMDACMGATHKRLIGSERGK